MSKAVQDYVKFNVLGIEQDLVSKEDKELLYKLTQRKNILSHCDKKYVIESYSLKKQADIFNGLNQRQGPKCRLTFMNDQNHPVQILGAEIKNDKILVCGH